MTWQEYEDQYGELPESNEKEMDKETEIFGPGGFHSWANPDL